MDVSIVNALGIESLDFLDLTFKLEQAFSIQLPKHSLIDHASNIVPRSQLVGQDGRITDLAAFLLQEGFNQFSSEQIRPGMTSYDVIQAATITNWANMCWGILGNAPTVCPDCGGKACEKSPQGRAICASCRTPVRYPSGDLCQQAIVQQIVQRWSPQAPTLITKQAAVAAGVSSK
jgi:hypothetical protein